MVAADQVSLSHFRQEYFHRYQAMFVQECGFFFPEERVEYFMKIILKFIKRTPFNDYGDFFTYLTATLPGKILFKQIVEEISIGETYFFRNVPQLDLLREHIIPELIRSKRINGVNSIRVWSAGCSTGEEVYTLAMLFLETLPTPRFWDLEIVGTDIKQSALQTAQEGIYTGARPRRHLTDYYLKKYFRMKDNRFEVTDELKRITRFSYHNLVKEYPPPVVDPDIIFCRNVTIYFNTRTVRRIVNGFYDLLHEDGYLFLGHSETIWQICDKFEILDFPKGFVYKKSELAGRKYHSMDTPASIPEFNLEKIDQEAPLAPSEDTPRIKTPGIPSIEDIRRDKELANLMNLDVQYHEGVLLFEKKKYDEAIRHFNDIIARDESYLLAHFAKATIYSNQGKYREAMKCLEFLIGSDNLFLEAYFLKSILLIKLQRKDKAIQTFQQVIYIDPDHALSYFHLANLYKEFGKTRHARLAWTNLKRVCQAKDPNAVVPFSDNLTYQTLETLAEKALADTP
jgi:chemotaxis protein methyltransferase CheR